MNDKKISQADLQVQESEQFWSEQLNRNLDFVKMTLPEIKGRVKSILPQDSETSGKDVQKQATATSLLTIVKNFFKSRRLPKKKIMDFSVCWLVEYFRPFMMFYLDNYRDHDGNTDEGMIKMSENIAKTIQYNNQNLGFTSVEQYYQQKERK